MFTLFILGLVLFPFLLLLFRNLFSGTWLLLVLNQLKSPSTVTVSKIAAIQKLYEPQRGRQNPRSILNQCYLNWKSHPGLFFCVQRPVKLSQNTTQKTALIHLSFVILPDVQLLILYQWARYEKCLFIHHFWDCPLKNIWVCLYIHLL